MCLPLQAVPCTSVCKAKSRELPTLLIVKHTKKLAASSVELGLVVFKLGDAQAPLAPALLVRLVLVVGQLQGGPLAVVLEPSVGAVFDQHSARLG